MSKEIILMLHPFFGVLGVLAAVWLFVEVLNAHPGNIARIRSAAFVAAAMIWLSCLAGGYWYVNFYGADRAVIKAGPWPFAHGFFMETKEHLFFSLLLLGTYLPIAAVSTGAVLAAERNARLLLLTLAGFVVLFGLAMEGFGAAVALGVKLGLMGR